MSVVSPDGSTSGSGGLLIVNADDWGGFREGTDAIETCFAAGAISSSTAMVNMADSRRAAEIALDRARPIGLHLNLTQPFDGPDVPPAVRERQRRLCGHFQRLGPRRWILSPDPRVHALVADAIRDQLEQFVELYKREPTHIDSHHHVHVCPDVFLSRALTRGLRVRQTLSPPPSARRDPRTVARELKHRALARRFVTTDRLWVARELSPAGGGVPIVIAVASARAQSVEIMTHPSFEGELWVLRSEAWQRALADAHLGSYSKLPSGPGG
ncbi:MAG TPA: ChbG/HpnK family deacetylase [Solirubrobacteraceae bacterium]|nr:ChbG/HpnK family deacetylase [Solirubrobacteraceae bacterium]